MTSDLKSATLITLVSMCILPPMASEAMTASEAMAASKCPQGSCMTSVLTSATMITLVFMCILPPTASEAMVAFEAMAASKRPQRSYDLRFDISNLDYPGIHAHIASNSHFGGL